METLLIQAIGFLAVIMYLVSFQFKSNRTLVSFQLAGNLLFALQFLLLGAASGSLSLLVSSIRNILLLNRGHWGWVNRRGFAAFFCVCYGLVAILTWEGPLSLLALLPSLSGTLSFWLNSARLIRLSNLFCACPCWLAYDILIGSWGGVLNETITMASILISIYRFGWKALGETQQS